MATFDFKKNLTNKNFKEIFDMIDIDGNQSISKEELRKFLNLGKGNPLVD